MAYLPKRSDLLVFHKPKLIVAFVADWGYCVVHMPVGYSVLELSALPIIDSREELDSGE